MNAAAFLADTGNIGLAVCAVLDTAGVISYALRARGAAGKWWKTPVGIHLMCFMAAFAIVLDQSVIYLLTGPGLIVTRAPGVQPDWFAWVRTVSFSVLIPGVLAWRLWLILWPPERLRLPLGAVVRVVAPGVCAEPGGQFQSGIKLRPAGVAVPVHECPDQHPVGFRLPQHAGRVVAGNVASRRAVHLHDVVAVRPGHLPPAALPLLGSQQLDILAVLADDLSPEFRLDSIPVLASPPPPVNTARRCGRLAISVFVRLRRLARPRLVLVESGLDERDQVIHAPHRLTTRRPA